MPESIEELVDSRWPGFYPSSVGYVTVCDGGRVILERVVGITIVNRFPFVMALSVCREALSSRHYARRQFMEVAEQGRCAAVQFAAPGPLLDAIQAAIAGLGDEDAHRRIGATRVATRPGTSVPAPILEGTYLVYEGRLVESSRDLEGSPIFERPWLDAGSHRVYFFEVRAIQLREDIAAGHRQIKWRSLPTWTPRYPDLGLTNAGDAAPVGERYWKSYNPDYAYPAATTTQFEGRETSHGMRIMELPSEPADQIEVDNDRSRWPCFFPSSVGMITVETPGGKPGLMPCGSTMVTSRHPMTISFCVSYARINVRYRPRATLEMVRKSRRFACGVPYLAKPIVEAIEYAGNTSIAEDADKVRHTGLGVEDLCGVPVLPALPVTFLCDVTREVRLGTHCMVVGEVRGIRVRADVTAENPLGWKPYPEVASTAPQGAALEVLESGG
jgi:flavin reductase (DIM6/NTAB) family NADH-FMN oxidoreductase RutF